MLTTIQELEQLRLESARLTDLAYNTRIDRIRAEDALCVLKRKEEALINAAKRAALEYQAGIERARRLAS